MNQCALFEQLTDENVLVEPRPNEFGFSEEFKDRVSVLQNRYAAGQSVGEELANLGDPERFSRLVEFLEVGDPDLASEIHALIEFLPDADIDDVVEFIHLSSQLDSKRGPSEGAPDGFLPIPVRYLRPLVACHHKTIVYVWRDECHPCDEMRRKLEIEVTPELNGLALFAVFGPEDPERLREEYQIVGGPALLFFLDGKVDARLYGNQPVAALEMEFETFSQLGH
jgi:thiol-disulfide isomerase/thioredoxin